MKLISLFSGIGGFELAAEWAGWENIVSCEINPFGQRVLKHYWPGSYHHDDVKTLTYKKINEEYKKSKGTLLQSSELVLAGGFPCQPYSAAGKRKGTEDDRHLWPCMLRVVREVKPKWVVGENVRGLTNWNGGLVFDQVQADLEALGYEVLPFLLPACALNAPHRRDRIWFVAYSDKCAKRSSRKSGGVIGSGGNNNDEPKERREQAEQHNGFNHVLQTFTDSRLLGQKVSEKQTTGIKQCDKGNASNANSGRQSGEEHGQTEPGWIAEASVPNYWENFPTQSPICGGNDGISDRLVGITFPKWRNESIKAFGNAIVPQVAYEIFKVINEMEKQKL